MTEDAWELTPDEAMEIIRRQMKELVERDEMIMSLKSENLQLRSRLLALDSKENDMALANNLIATSTPTGFCNSTAFPPPAINSIHKELIKKNDLISPSPNHKLKLNCIILSALKKLDKRNVPADIPLERIVNILINVIRNKIVQNEPVHSKVTPRTLTYNNNSGSESDSDEEFADDIDKYHLSDAWKVINPFVNPDLIFQRPADVIDLENVFPSARRRLLLRMKNSPFRISSSSQPLSLTLTNHPADFPSLQILCMQKIMTPTFLGSSFRSFTQATYDYLRA
eukprot:TRINITY_DN10695_c0_g1_i2.p1 TRINITY_DN10695_c0_g1~~TRINITY_DN10695_c0_g1_i2.p1  ORF type:complete len:283 (+),score=41.25 TRINITY_DN10695_c0_g1_i2:113-961(+)